MMVALNHSVLGWFVENCYSAPSFTLLWIQVWSESPLEQEIKPVIPKENQF